MDDCIFPPGKHFWSVPEPSGRQTCLWCPAEKWPEPIDASPTPPDPGHEKG